MDRRGAPDRDEQSVEEAHRLVPLSPETERMLREAGERFAKGFRPVPVRLTPPREE